MKAWRSVLCFAAAAGSICGQGRGPVLRPVSPYGIPGAQQQAPRPAPVGAGVIEGQVVNASTGMPLKKCNVRLFGIPDPNNPNPTRSTSATDEAGRFRFTNLGPGRYSLSAERQGYLTSSYGARRLSGNGAPVTLGQDQQLKDLVIKLSPQAVIVGRVVDEDGDPVANVNVQALRYMYRQGVKRWAPAGNGQSSDIGEFRIPALQPGRYLVSAGGRGFGGDFNPFAPNQPLLDKPETAYTTTYYPNSTDTTTAAPVDVSAAAEVRGIEIHLQKMKVFRVRGKVTNAPAGGRGNTMVFLMPRESETAGLVMRRYNGIARPPDGVFEIRGVPAGSYTLYAQANGQGQQFIAAQPLEIGSSHVDGVSLTLGSGNDVQGIVKVVDSAAPVDLPNLTVMLRPAPGAAMGGPPRAKVAEGRFTLKSVPPSRFAVTVTGLPENCYVKSIQYSGREIGQNETVEMGSAAPLEVTISANAAALDVAVVDKDGRPAQGATLLLIGKNGTPSFTRGGAPDNGIVSFKGLPPGEYRVFAWEDVEQGAPQDPEFRKHFESKSQTIKIEPGTAAKAQARAIPVDEMPGSR